MTTKRFLLPLLLFSLIAAYALGQQRCATMEADAELRSLHPELGSLDYLEKVISAHLEAGAQSRVVNGTLIIPVVVHVIHSNEALGSGTNISDAQVLSQIDVLNEDFGRYGNGLNTHPNGANTGIQFCLAKRKPDGSATNGIDRLFYGAAPYNFTAPPYSVRSYIESTIKPATGWDPTRYLNLWCLNFGSSLLGYAQFPSASGLPGMNCSGGNNNTDGIAMQYNAFGRVGTLLAGYSKGKTCTHEVGHWLGLRHIWGDATCGDDFCADTPTHETQNYGCPTHPKPNNCGTADEMVENYMDYTNDVCMNIFTNDQATRMRTVLLASPLRLSLLSSDACIPPATDDAAIVNIQSPTTDVCPGPITPLVTLKNMGANTLTSATIQYQWNGGVINSQSFTGSLAPGASQNITLPSFTVSPGAQFLRVYSILPNGVSDPNTLGDTTDVSFTAWTGASVPYSEPFEAVSWPPSGWNINNASNDCYTWRKVTGIRGSSGSNTGTIWINHFAYTTNLGDSDEVSTNILNLSSATANTYLTFDVAYAARSSTNFESLRLYASTDCGATYPFLLYNKNGMGSGASNLSTVSGFVGGSFSPSGASQWRREIIPLSSFAGSNIRLKWVAVNRNGNNLYLDNIEVKDGRLVGFTTSTGNFVESSSGGTQGCLGYQDYQVSVGINAAPSTSITVNASLLLGTALSSDVQLITNSLVFPAGSAANQNVTIRVWDDAAIESPRSFTLVLSSSSPAVIVQNNAFSGTIIDNDQNLGAGVVTLFTQNFESATNGTTLPSGWTTPATTGATNVFVIGPNAGLGGTKALYISNNTTTLPNSYTLTSTTNRAVQTPVINTTGMANLLLNFSIVSAGEVFGTTVYDFGALYYSTTPTGPFTQIVGPAYATNTFTNGGSGFYNITQPSTVSLYLPEACEGLSTLYLTWRWRNDNTDGSQPPIAIDDIVLTGASVPSVATDINSTDTEYLGPNQIVTFRSATGALIAKITNNSSFDYGCTTVSIDNQGTGVRAYYNSTTANHLAAKSILVQPTNNSATGSYDLTIFFTTAEASGYTTATGGSWTSTSNVLYKSNGAIGNVTPTQYIGNGTTNQQVGTQISTRDLTASVRRVQARFNTGFRSGGPTGFAAGNAGSRTIALNPNGGSACLGSVQTIAFYGLGNFATGNVFVANLSASGGSFPVVNNIGSVTAASNGCYSGTISATFPSSGGGNNFLIRVEPSAVPSTTYTPSGSFYLGGSGTWRGTSSTDWSVASNWCGSVPTSTVDVVVPTGNAFLPALSTASVCRGLTLNSDATLNLNNQSLSLSGALSGAGRIIGSPTSNLTLSGTANGNLLMDNTNLNSRSLSSLNLSYSSSPISLALGDSLVLTTALNISSGTLQTTNRLRLTSNATKTAYISALNNNAIIQGDVVAEKFAPGGKTGWALIGNPVSGDNILDWQDDFPTSGFAGATGYAGGFTSVYRYNETLSGSNSLGYAPPTSSSETVIPGKGYMVYLGTAFPNTPNITIDAAGPPATGTFSLPVTYTPSIPNALPFDDGWCLLANPYCSTIDWDSPNWTRTNMGNYFYVYNADLGSYGTYVGGTPGVGTNGATNLIGAFQGFWVKATGTNPVLTLTEQVKSTNQSPLLRTANPMLNTIRVRAENSDGKDEALVVFDDGTENLVQVPKQWPWKENCPGVALVADSLHPLAIMQISQQPSIGRIPLTFSKGKPAQLVITPELASDARIFLEDTHLGSLHPVKNREENALLLDSLSVQGRYFLTWSAPNSETEIRANSWLFPNPANRSAWFSTSEKGPFELSWFTLDGRLVHRLQEVENGQGPLDLSHLETGVYLVEIKGLDKQRKVIKFVVKS